jgi:hypothetical protein
MRCGIRSRSAARLLAGVLLLGTTLAQAAGTPLDAYLDNLKTLRANTTRPPTERGPPS